MLIGEYRHTIDIKKRIAVPAAFRKELGKKVIVTRGLDNCLFVYPLAFWHKFTEKLDTLSHGQADARSFNRFIFGGAVESEIDSLGRILVPDFLKDFAGLKNKVVVAGINDRVEIWDEKRWKEYTERIEKQADALAEKLGEIGVF
jgi:MraZ protein